MHFRLLALFAVAMPLVCAAQSASDWDRTTLSGDWGGRRADWYRRGAALDVVLTADAFRNASGGLSRGSAALSQLDARLTLDLSRLAGWRDSFAVLQLISVNGPDPNARNVGSFQGVDNVAVTKDETKIYQAYLERELDDGNLSLRGGRYAMDSEFNVNEASGVFLNPAFGTSPELAQTGRDGPSIYPNASLGVRLRYRPLHGAYVQAAAFDRADGGLWIVEAGLRPSQLEQALAPVRTRRGPQIPPPARAERVARPISKIALGAWGYAERFPDLSAQDAAGAPLRRRTHGAYLLGEETLFQEANDPAQGLSAFFSVGVADRETNTVERALVYGLRYKGLFPGRGEDELGIGMSRAYASPGYVQATELAGTPIADPESATELTYRAQLRPWLAVQPTLQRISHPGFGASGRAATVIGVRFELAL